MEGGTNTLLVEPIPQIIGAVREESGQFSGPVALRFGLDLLANVLKITKIII
jgi:hypothetical protein